VAIDTSVPQSPGWWVKRLQSMMGLRTKRLELLDLYYRGDPPFPRELMGPDHEHFRHFMRRSRTNFAELVVEAVRERMVITGFRTKAASDDLGDSEAWSIWKDNNLGIESTEIHELMLSLGDSYAIVGMDNDTARPVITGEDPRQVITAHDPARPQKILAGLKLFHDEVNDLDLAYLYLPGRVLVAGNQRKARPDASAAVTFSPTVWNWLDGYFEPVTDIEDEALVEAQSLPGDVVPVVRFRNKRGRGEFEGHMDLLERINHTILQRLIIGTFQAFRQRAAIGDMPEADPESGETIDYDKLFSADPGALWKLPAGVQMWESSQGDLSAILNAVKADVEHLAAVTRTPMHYLTPGQETQSAEGASLAREGLVFKTEDRIGRASVAWVRALSMAFLFSGDDDRADLDALQPIWSPVERYSLSEQAAADQQGISLPWESKMERIYQLTPEELARAKAQRQDDQVLAQQQAMLAAAARPAAPAPESGNAG
jgi:hypothetical protein